MDQKQIQTFKHDLMDLNARKKEVKRLEDEIKALDNSKRPFVSNDIIRPSGNTNPRPYPYDRIERIDQEIEAKNKIIDAYMVLIHYTERRLESIEDPLIKKALIEIYVENRSAKAVAKEIGYADDSSLYKSIRLYLEKRA